MWRQYPEVEPALYNRLKSEQEQLASKVVIQKPDFEIRLIAGCDSSFLGENLSKILSVFAVLEYPSLQIVEVKHSVSDVTLPYVPGFLAFREAPNLLKAYAMLENKPDIIMADGHGISHPRKLGIASHIGVLLNKPAMGVAKKVLVGKFEEPGLEKGNYTPLMYKGEHIAYALRTKDKVKPVFVSAGHLFDNDSAKELALSCTLKHKLPEPTRIADKLAGELKYT